MIRLGNDKNQGRLRPSKISGAAILSFLLIFGQTAPVLGNPTGGAVVAGSAGISSSGNTLTVNQSTAAAIINWRQFSINSGELTKFLVPNSSSATLNRVLGGNPSLIYGTLQSNGVVYLVNGSGIVVGPNGRIDTAGFIGSTLDVSDDEFLKGGNLHFLGSSDASVNNQGLIHASGGDVYLIANQVNNSGTIMAPQGNVGLAAGSNVLYQPAGDQHLFVQANPVGTTRAVGVNNTGTIRAATAELKAAGGNAYALAINNAGNIAATGFKKINGQVYLTADGGDITNSGKISAKNPNGNGGTIVVDGSGAASSGTVRNSGTLDASATAAGGQGGSVTLKSKGNGSGTAIQSGTILAKGGQGGTGGKVDVSGNSVQLSGTVNTTAPGGQTGTFLIDPTTFTVTASPTGPDEESGSAVGTSLETSNVELNADTLVLINDNITWTSDNTLTLSTNNSSATVDINGNITGLNGGLTIMGTSTNPTEGLAGGNIQVANFILQNADWAQYATTLPTFIASHDFELQSGSTFLRVTGGDGGSNPYQLTDIYGVQGIASPGSTGNYPMLDLSFELMNNVDATSTATWNSGTGFVPIGNNSSTFRGTFDGGGFVINGLTINLPSAVNVGLFGVGNSTTLLENVGLTNVQINGGYNVGGLIAATNTGTVLNSYTTGSVAGVDEVGGLVGVNYPGTITNSYSTVTVSGTSAVGGLVGNNTSGTISNSYSSGAVTGASGSEFVGGLVGENYNGTISNSYSTGAVSAGNASYDVGGLVGLDTYGTITDTYSSGAVTGGSGSSDVGGLVGLDSYGETAITASFWDSSTAGVTLGVGSNLTNTTAGVTGDPTSTLLSAATYSAWNIGTDPTPTTGNTWVILDTQTRPMLSMEYSTTITNAHQLQLIGLNSTTLSASYTLANNIDLSGITNPSEVWGTSTTNGGAGFVPIGNSTTNFTGTFNGQGYTVNGLYINLPGSSYVGLFGAADGTIENVNINNVQVTGNNAVGALAGANYNIVNQASSTGTVTGTYEVGGLVGQNSASLSIASSTAAVVGEVYVGGLTGVNGSGASITDASSTGSVTGNNGSGNSYLGGLVGANYSQISNTDSTGTVTGGPGAEDVGGLVGNNAGTGIIDTSYSSVNITSLTGHYNMGGLVGYNSGQINNSYSLGSITVGSATTSVGGFVGNNAAGTISNSYSTGLVSGTSSYAGGFAGYNAATISNSFWDTTTSGFSTIGIGGDNISGVTGSTTTSSTNNLRSLATYSGAGWNIGTDPTSNTWVIIDGQTRPMLSMEYGTTITNAHQLQLIDLNSTTLAASYTLANNIDLSGTTNASDVWGTSFANSGQGFVPIGNDTTVFSGTFDGQDHTISGLYIYRLSSNDVGLFGTTTGVLENVSLTGVLVSGEYYVGGLAGDIGNDISATPGTGSITYASSSGSVSGTGYVGGLVGLDHGTSITLSSSAGSVDGNGFVGGLEGSTLSHLSNVFSTASVSGGGTLGGLVGENYTGGTITNAYSTGTVSLVSEVGGLVGRNLGTISNSFWDTSTSGITSSTGGVGSGSNAGVTGATTSQLMSQTFILNNSPSSPTWDFTNVWTTNGDTALPQLTGQPAVTSPSVSDTLSGTAYIDDGNAPSSTSVTISLVFNGSQIDSTTTTSGAFTFDLSSSEFSDLTTGILLIDGTHNGNTFYQANSPAVTISGIDLWGNTLRVQADAASNSALAAAAGRASGVNYTVEGTNLTTNSGVNLVVLSNYNLDGNVTASGTLTTNAAAMLTGSANVTLTGNSVAMSGSFNRTGSLTVASTAGEIVLEGVGTSENPATANGLTLNSNSSGAVIVDNSYINLGGGDFSATGTGFASTTQSTGIGGSDGVDIYSSTINAQGGAINITGTAGYFQNTYYGSTELSAGNGVNIGDSTIETSGSAAINITGYGPSSVISQTGFSGVSINNFLYGNSGTGSGSTITAQDGMITITGTVSTGTVSNGNGGGIYGIAIQDNSIIQTTGTAGTDCITLTGNTSGSAVYGEDDIGVYINGYDFNNDLSYTATVSVGTELNPSSGSGITITGTGGTVYVDPNSSQGGNADGFNMTQGASIIATGTAPISITGTGGTNNVTDNSASGVNISTDKRGSDLVQSDAGDITIKGYAGTGSSNAIGVLVAATNQTSDPEGQVTTSIETTTSGNIYITGIGGNGYTGPSQVSGTTVPNVGIAVADYSTIETNSSFLEIGSPSTSDAISLTGTAGNNGSGGYNTFGVSVLELPSGSFDDYPVLPTINAGTNFTATALSGTGVHFNGNLTAAGATFGTGTQGNILATTSGPVDIENSNITLGGGDLNVYGAGNAIDLTGIKIVSTTSDANDGNYFLTGEAAAGYNATVNGTVAGEGVALNGTSLTTESTGGISIWGDASVGVSVQNSLIGVEVNNSTLTTENGSIAIIGTVNSGTALATTAAQEAGFGGNGVAGVAVDSGSTIQTNGYSDSDDGDDFVPDFGSGGNFGGGAITITGNASLSTSESSSYGVLLSDATVSAVDDTGVTITGINIRGTAGNLANEEQFSAADGIEVNGGSSIYASGTAPIVLTGFGGSDTNTDQTLGTRAYGVYIVSSSSTEFNSVGTNSGTLTLTGTGGASMVDSEGVALNGNYGTLDTVEAYSNSGNIIINGSLPLAGNTSISLMRGVSIFDSAQVDTETGAISITGNVNNGTANLGSEDIHGVEIGDGAEVTTFGTGSSIAIFGDTTGTTASQNNIGVVVFGSTVSSAGNGTAFVDRGGATPVTYTGLYIQGTAGGNSNVPTSADSTGILIEDGAQITTSNSANLTLNGTAGFGQDNNTGVFITGSSTTLQAGDATQPIDTSGLLTIIGNGSNSGVTGQNNQGVTLFNDSNLISGSGGISITGTAPTGGTNYNYGVAVDQATMATYSGGAITIQGTAAGSGIDNQGVSVFNIASITSDTGAISITGTSTAGGTSYNTGVTIDESTVTTGGAGTLTLMGTSAGGSDYLNEGVSISYGATLSAGSGGVSITGTAGASPNGGIGVDVSPLTGAPISISSTSGLIYIDGTGATGNTGSSPDANPYVANDGIRITDTSTLSGANITLIGSGSGSNATGVAVTPYLTSGAPTLTLGEAGTLNVTTTSGDIIFNSVGTALDPLRAATAYFDSGGGVQFSSDYLSLSGGNLTLSGTGSSTDNYTGITITNSILNAGTGAISLTGYADASNDNSSAGATGPGLGVGLFNSTVETAGTGTITIMGTGSIGSVADPVTGSGSLDGFDMNASSMVQTVDGAISITGDVNRGTTSSGQSITGIQINGGTVKATGLGSISLTGDASGSTASYFDEGVYLTSATLSVAGGTGGITINGTAGDVANSTTSPFCLGIDVIDGVTITAGGAAPISLTGTGGTDNNTDTTFQTLPFGVELSSNTGANTTILSGSGDITITGTSGVGNYQNGGVFLYQYAGTDSITSTTGNITINGYVPYASNVSSALFGVVLRGGASVLADNETVSVTGDVSAGTSATRDFGIRVSEGSSIMADGANGGVTLNGDTTGSSAQGIEAGVIVEGANSVVSASGEEGLTVNGTSSSLGGSAGPIVVDVGGDNVSYFPTTAGIIVSDAGELVALSTAPMTLNGTGGANTNADSHSSSLGVLVISPLSTESTGILAGTGLVSITGNAGSSVSLRKGVLIGGSLSAGAVSVIASGTIAFFGNSIDLNTVGPNIITIDTTGNVTQNGQIDANLLTIQNAAAVTLTDPTNEISALGNITHSGALQIVTDPGLAIDGLISGNAPVTIEETAGDLTFGTNGQIIDSGSGNNVVLAAGTNLGNSAYILNDSSAGANAIQVSGGANYNIYSADPTYDSLGGLTPDLSLYGVSFPTTTSPGQNVALFYASQGGSGPNGPQSSNSGSSGTNSDNSNTTQSQLTPQNDTIDPQTVPPSGYNGNGVNSDSPTMQFASYTPGNGTSNQIGQDSSQLANSSGGSGDISSGDAAQLNAGQLNNVSNPAAANALNQALSAAVRGNLADALKALGDFTVDADKGTGNGSSFVDHDDSSHGKKHPQGKQIVENHEIILNGGDVAEIGDKGVQSIALSQTPKPLRDALADNTLTGAH